MACGAFAQWHQWQEGREWEWMLALELWLALGRTTVRALPHVLLPVVGGGVCNTGDCKPAAVHTNPKRRQPRRRRASHSGHTVPVYISTVLPGRDASTNGYGLRYVVLPDGCPTTKRRGDQVLRGILTTSKPREAQKEKEYF